MISGQEMILVGPQSSSTLSGFVLPSGEPGTRLVQLVATVADNLGSSIRCTWGADLTTPAVVRSTPYVIAGNAAAAVSSLQASLLGDGLKQGKSEDVLSNVALLSRIFADSTDPCALLSCGSYGTCFAGVCVCSLSDGYSGTLCDVPPTPVDGVLSEWSAWSTCSAVCGDGVQQAARTCQAPRFGGNPCDGLLQDSRACRLRDCGSTETPSYEWSEWSACTAVCELGVAGVAQGTKTASRACPPGVACTQLTSGNAPVQLPPHAFSFYL